MNAMNIPEKLSRSNGKAVSLLMEGRCAESGAEFKNVLSQLKSIFESQPAERRSGDAEEEPCRSCCEDSISSVEIPLDTSSSVAQLGAFCLFNRALVINSDRMKEDRISGVLLYNAALCHHIHAIKQCSSKELDAALHFYQYAFALLARSGDDMESDDALLLLALINNMGHIYSNKFDMPAANHCMDMMQRYFAATDGGYHLMECDSLFFYMNTFLVNMAQFSSAPAA